MLKRYLLHVEEKECLKACRKGVKMSSTSTVQGQQSPESPQAAIVCLPFCEIMEKDLNHGSVPGNQVSHLQMWAAESYRQYKQSLILGTGTSFALCLSKCINSPNYMKKFPGPRTFNKAGLTNTNCGGN